MAHHSNNSRRISSNGNHHQTEEEQAGKGQRVNKIGSIKKCDLDEYSLFESAMCRAQAAVLCLGSWPLGFCSEMATCCNNEFLLTLKIGKDLGEKEDVRI